MVVSLVGMSSDRTVVTSASLSVTCNRLCLLASSAPCIASLLYNFHLDINSGRNSYYSENRERAGIDGVLTCRFARRNKHRSSDSSKALLKLCRPSVCS